MPRSILHTFYNIIIHNVPIHNNMIPRYIVTIKEKLDTWYTLIRNVVIIQYILYKGTSTLNMYQARERLKVNFTYNHLRSWHTIYRLHEPNNVIRCEKNLIWPVMIKHYAWNRILFFWFSIAYKNKSFSIKMTLHVRT